jgi:hypothetical protein
MAALYLTVYQESGSLVQTLSLAGVSVLLFSGHLFIVLPFPIDVCPTSGSNSEKNSPAEILAIIALVGAVCGFTTGLLLCVLMTRCYVHFCGKEKRCQTEKTERAHFYEDIPLQNTSAAEPVQLKTNEAYGHF